MKLVSVFLGGVLVIVPPASKAMPADSTSVASVSTVMLPGEELVYEVSWTFFKLGRIRLLALQADSPGVAYRSVAYSDSYSLPFVDFHAYSTAEMDSTLFSKGATLFEKNGDRWHRQMYRFLVPTRTFITENAYVNNLHQLPDPTTTYDTLRLSFDRFQDGTSILYFARAHIHDGRAIAVPTLVRGKAGRTEFYLPAERTTEHIDAFPFPLRAVQLEGKADFEGIFGLTGDFTGWFSDDAAAIPLKAKMKVILGSINIELIEWKRPGWVPPGTE